MKCGSEIRKIAFVGDYLPRKCGIATFTHDMCASVAGQYPGRRVLRRAGQRPPRGVRLPAGGPVRDRRAGPGLLPPGGRLPELRATPTSSASSTSTASTAAPAGSHILGLLRDLRMPVVTTFHTVLREPNADQRRVLTQLAEPVRPGRRHDRAGADVPQRDLRRPRGQDRPDRPRHPRHAVRRPEPLQGPVRRRGPAGGADVRAALAEQGHRAHAPGGARRSSRSSPTSSTSSWGRPTRTWCASRASATG